MNTKSIEFARDPDLRSSQAAMQRAARRARELAAQTGTALIVSHNGVIKSIQFGADGEPLVRESGTSVASTD